MSDGTTAQGILLRALVQKLSHMLQLPPIDIEASRPIHTLGVDSLVAIEIRYWFLKEAKATLSVFDIIGDLPLKAVIALAWEKSLYRLGRSSGKV